MALIALLLFTVNYAGSIQLLQSRDNDLYYVQARSLQAASTNPALIVLGDGINLKEYVSRFTGIDVVETLGTLHAHGGDIDAALLNLRERVEEALLRGDVVVAEDAATGNDGSGDPRWTDSLRDLWPRINALQRRVSNGGRSDLVLEGTRRSEQGD